jgi:L-asparaginase
MVLPIRLLITGGTLDKDYNPLSGQLDFPGSQLPNLLVQANHTLTIHTQVLMQKDSLEMTDADRETILAACQLAKESALVITHGTDTMQRTAEFLAQANLDKTIILVGAMRPFSLGHSDASFNIGAALAWVQTEKSGVYIAMNGRLWPAHQVQKNPIKGVFESRA